MPKPRMPSPLKSANKTKGDAATKRRAICPVCHEPFDSHGAGGNCNPPRGRTARRAKSPTLKNVTDHRDKTLANLAMKGGGLRLV